MDIIPTAIHTAVEIIGWIFIALLLLTTFSALVVAGRYDDEGKLDDMPAFLRNRKL